MRYPLGSISIRPSSYRRGFKLNDIVWAGLEVHRMKGPAHMQITANHKKPAKISQSVSKMCMKLHFTHHPEGTLCYTLGYTKIRSSGKVGLSKKRRKYVI